MWERLPGWLQALLIVGGIMLAIFVVVRSMTYQETPAGDCKFLWKDSPEYIEYC